MTDPQTLRDAFKRKRYGAGEYEPDFDLFDAAADEIEGLRKALKDLLWCAENLQETDSDRFTKAAAVARRALGLSA